MNFMSIVPFGSPAMTLNSSCEVGIFSFRFLLVESQPCIAFSSRKAAKSLFTSSVDYQKRQARQAMETRQTGQAVTAGLRHASKIGEKNTDTKMRSKGQPLWSTWHWDKLCGSKRKEVRKGEI